MQKIPKLHKAKFIEAMILRRMRHPGLAKKTARISDIYEARLWFKLDNLRDIDNEMRHVLARLTRSKKLLQYSVSVKMYYISWATISDILAAILNETFDLGIPEKNLNLAMVLENRHVSKSPINEIKRKYTRLLKHSEFQKIRNDIIHRGELSILAYHEFRDQASRFALNNILNLEITRDERQKYLSGLTSLLHTTAKSLREHYSLTVEMLNEIFGALHSVIKIKGAAPDKRDVDEFASQVQR